MTGVRQAGSWLDNEGVDPLHDPDDEALLDPRQARDLAGLVETARMSSAVIRYGLRTRVGAATVVLNQDNPLPTANHAFGLWGTSAEVANTLLDLEQVFAEAGRDEALLYASPTTVSEIDGIADDTGWMAVEEQVALVHRAGRGTSGRARPAEDRDLAEIAELIADDAELPAEAEQRLLRNIGHRSDDPRCVFLVLDDPAADRIAGFAQGFVEHGVGLVEQVLVRPGRRRRGIGRELVGETAHELYARGALLIAAHSEQGSAVEAFADTCGFEAVYEVTAYARRVDELM